jgi:hypothetical protein
VQLFNSERTPTFLLAPFGSSIWDHKLTRQRLGGVSNARSAGLDLRAKGWLQRAYDLDVYHLENVNHGRVPILASGTSPLLVVVGPKRSGEKSHLLAVLAITNATTGVFDRPEEWTVKGTIQYPGNVDTNAGPNTNSASPIQLNRPSASRSNEGDSFGCNRIRVHQPSRRAAYSCFGGGPGHDVVGFVDLIDPQNPSVLGTVPFVTEQPTGMLMLGDALFVAGELDIMVFDMGNATPAAPPAVATEVNANVQLPRVVATCGAACAKVGKAKGQNFHSIAYKLTAAGRHLIFISAQIDNAIGCVEIVDPQIIALIQTATRTTGLR